MPKYPIFLEMRGRRAVIIGAGPVAVRKAQGLLAAGARLVVVAETADNMMTSLCQGKAELVRSRYSKDFLGGASLVIAATNDHKLNRQIYRDCQSLEILCNVVDEPELCDFFVPAVVKRGDLQIAVGTEGDCPAYAGHVRRKLEQTFTKEHGDFLAELERLRQGIIKSVANPGERKTILGKLVDDKSFEYFVQNGPAEWRRYADEIIQQTKQGTTTGAGEAVRQ